MAQLVIAGLEAGGGGDVHRDAKHGAQRSRPGVCPSFCGGPDSAYLGLVGHVKKERSDTPWNDPFTNVPTFLAHGPYKHVTASLPTPGLDEEQHE